MEHYVCDRCGYATNHRNNFRKHIYRKFPCKPKKKNVDLQVVRSKYNMHRDSKDDDKGDFYYCKHCFQNFTRKNNLRYHLKHKCKHRKINYKKDFFGNLLKLGYITVDDFTDTELNKFLKKGVENLLIREKRNSPRYVDPIDYETSSCDDEEETFTPENEYSI